MQVTRREMVEAWMRLLVAVIVVVTLTTSSVWAGVQDVEAGWRTHGEDSAGGCASLSLCCEGKNNTCRADGPRVTNSDSFTCFCDSSCIELGDCCVDYKTTCQRQYNLPHVHSQTKTPHTSSCSGLVVQDAVQLAVQPISYKFYDKSGAAEPVRQRQ